MIKVDISESFPITVSLLDEDTGDLVSGETVAYDIRNINDTPLSPPINGTLTESSVEPGIYRVSISIPTSGSYVCYASSSNGFITNTEEILVNAENMYSLIKQERHYNMSIEDVLRTSSTPTASQAARNVPKNTTDYIITRIKNNGDPDWSSTTVSGVVYAHYKTTHDSAPYKMGGPS